MKNLPGFTAESSLFREGNFYLARRTSQNDGRVVPQEPPLLGCVRVSPYYCACGVEDEGSKTSHWVIVRC